MLQGDDGVADPVGALARGEEGGKEEGPGAPRGSPVGRCHAVSVAGISDSMNFDVRCAWRFSA